MTSLKARRLFLVAIGLFILHGVEEFLVGFYKIDVSFLLTAGRMGRNLPLIFALYQAVLWLLLFLAYFLFRKNKLARPILITLVATMILELQHLYETLVAGKYYPGTYTAVMFPVIAVLLWKEFGNLGKGSDRGGSGYDGKQP